MQQILQSPQRSVVLPPSRFVSAEIPGVHVLPRMLTDVQIREIIGLKELKCHHDDGSHGHGDVGHGGPPEKEKDKQKEKEDKNPDKKKDPKVEHELFRANKPHVLPWVAELIYGNIPEICINGMRSCGVDENMQLYRLQEGAGVVPQHVDEDFDGPDNTRALCSILVYLNNGYVGGETVFNSTTPAPRVAVGGGLVFRHDILHEGLTVLSGEKYVLKTDLLFRSQ
jgi:hypothetical protein